MGKPIACMILSSSAGAIVCVFVMVLISRIARKAVMQTVALPNAEQTDPGIASE